MLIASQVNALAAQPVSQWKRLAAVARERASDQSAKAAAAADVTAAEPHLEQQAYLVRLAEVYEQRARAARGF